MRSVGLVPGEVDILAVFLAIATAHPAFSSRLLSGCIDFVGNRLEGENRLQERRDNDGTTPLLFLLAAC